MAPRVWLGLPAIGVAWGAMTSATGHAGHPILQLLAPTMDSAWSWCWFPFFVALCLPTGWLASATAAAASLSTAGAAYSLGDFVAGETDATGLVADASFWLVATIITGFGFGLLGTWYRRTPSRVSKVAAAVVVVSVAIADSGRKFVLDPRLETATDSLLLGGYALAFGIVATLGTWLLFRAIRQPS